MTTLTAEIPGQALVWRNDPKINIWCRQDGLISWQAQERWLEKIDADPTIRMFGIWHAKAPIGVCGLTSIDRQNRCAEFSLYIGPEHQREGHAPVALKLLLSHGFKDMGLNRIWGEVFDGNPAMGMFEKIGFRREGTLRDTYWKNGKFIDSHMISILAEEFE